MQLGMMEQQLLKKMKLAVAAGFVVFHEDTLGLDRGVFISMDSTQQSDGNSPTESSPLVDFKSRRCRT